MIKKTNIRIGISVGDINGIGLEVILKTFQNPKMLEMCTPVIFASNKVVSFMIRHLKMKVAYNGITDVKAIIQGRINIMNCWNDNPKILFGQETQEAGFYAIESLKSAVKSLRDKDIDALVTAPINKNNIQSDDFHFPGHTDYLAQELQGDSLMFLVSDTLRVGLLTDHLPIKMVSAQITQELIERKVKLVEESLKKDFRIEKPKIAILGLNPHCGDSGVIGDEDDKIISPTIAKLFAEGIYIFGPYSADSFFVSQYQMFDAVIAPYHDQGLIPFKTLTFGQGVNFTAGLNRVRTSPDHGTAYAIAGKGIADYSSFRQAVYSAIDIFRNRTQYEQWIANAM